MRTTGQQPQAPRETSQQRRRRQDRAARSGQLDRQRQTIDLFTDRCHLRERSRLVNANSGQAVRARSTKS